MVMRMDHRRQRPVPPHLLVFRGFCRQWVQQTEDWKKELLSAIDVAGDLGMEVDTVRKAARKLTKMGWLRLNCISLRGDVQKFRVCKGYAITDEGVETEIFREEIGDRRF